MHDELSRSQHRIIAKVFHAELLTKEDYDLFG
jgi:hypothetical protein